MVKEPRPPPHLCRQVRHHTLLPARDVGQERFRRCLFHLHFQGHGETCLSIFVGQHPRAHQPSKKETGNSKEDAEHVRADVIVLSL